MQQVPNATSFVLSFSLKLILQLLLLIFHLENENLYELWNRKQVKSFTNIFERKTKRDLYHLFVIWIFLTSN